MQYESSETGPQSDHRGRPIADESRRTEALTGATKNLFETYWVEGASHRPSWVTRPAALWLESKLHFPNWTVHAIETLPQTHISEWAARNQIPMDKAYVSEDREGGVMALGDDIAGIPRDQLNAVPDALWGREKDRFVYAAWVRHALRAASIQGPGSSQ